MPTQLERRLSSKNSQRRSIKPIRRTDRDSSDSDNSGPGAVGEDFFVPPSPQQQQKAGGTSPDRPHGLSPPPVAAHLPVPVATAPVAVTAIPKTEYFPISTQVNHQTPGEQPGLRERSASNMQREPRNNRGTSVREQSGQDPHAHNAQRQRATVSDKELVDKSAVRHCQYLGDISHVPLSFNTNNRSRLLSLIDNSRRQGRLPWIPHSKHNICLAFSAKDLRLMDQRGQAVIVRLPLHKVASVSYLHDDLQHLVIVHAGSEEDRSKGLLHIFHFSTQESAEEMCAIMGRCFDLLYTDATMAMLDQSIVGDDKSPMRGGAGKSLQRGASPDQYYPNISSSLVSELHDVHRIAAPHDVASSALPQRGNSLMRQMPSTAADGGAKVPSPPAAAPPSSMPASSPPVPNMPAVDAQSGPPAPPPPGAGPAVLPPPSSRPVLTDAVGMGQSRKKLATPGVGMVAVYDSDESETEAPQRPGGMGGPVMPPPQQQQAQPPPHQDSVTEEAAVVVQRYMKVMHKLVSSDELREFADLVKRYRDDLPIAQFCSRLDKLFGPTRQFMLPGMRGFIPSDDLFYFESFLQEKQVGNLRIPDDLLEV